MEIPIIDLFAGPGGLGEGFSAFSFNGKSIFKIKLSIEKDESAHRTLELRAFYRQFADSVVPSSYYEYLRGTISREELFSKHLKEAAIAKKEAWQAELGKTDPDIVKSRIADALDGATNWVLIGGPPCQAYSLMGRSKLRGQSMWKYARDRRHFLYKEYLQILADHQPPVFVMENVKGLLSSRRTKKNKLNTFELIISDLKQPLDAKRKGTDSLLVYRLFSCSIKRADDKLEPKDFVVRSEEYGIPQARHRVIIFGIRSDIYKSVPEILEKVTKQVSIDDVIGDLPKLRSGLSKEEDSASKWRDAIKSIENAKWLKTEKPLFRQAITSTIKRVGASLDRGGLFVPLIVAPKKYHDWYVDDA